ncbi:MAG: hypothetical protein WD039_10285 [Xanthobacteraceae bacterium]
MKGKRLFGGLGAIAMGVCATVAMAAPEHLTTIESECGARLRLPAGGCTCMRERAASLKDGQQAFVAAVVSKNKAEQARIQQGLTVRELTEAGMFMTQAPAQCARR